MNHVESLEAAERAAFEVLSRQLAGHLALTGDTFNFLNRVLGGAPEVPVREVSQARKVATALFLRLTNDLRGVAFLAPRGYPLQAVSLVAPMYEGATARIAGPGRLPAGTSRRAGRSCARCAACAVARVECTRKPRAGARDPEKSGGLLREGGRDA